MNTPQIFGRLRAARPTVSALIAALAATAFTACSTTSAEDEGPEWVKVSAASPAIQYSGRSVGIGTEEVSFGYSGARVRMRFEGSSIGMWMDDQKDGNYVLVWVDGKARQKLQLKAPDDFYLLAEDLPEGPHTIEVVRVTECYLGLNRFQGFALSAGGQVLPWEVGPDRKIEFIGDSITCGYGVEVDDPTLSFEPATENFCLGYSGLTARQLDADYLVVSRSGIGMVRNFNGPFEGSEDTMPGNYLGTFYLQPEPAWDFAQYTPDVVCINLGTNDFSTTGVNVETYVATYVEFASDILSRYPEAQLVLIGGSMENRDHFRAALARVETALKEIEPDRVHRLLLTPQGPVGMGADYHPNRAQSAINAAELTAFLSELMDWPVAE